MHYGLIDSKLCSRISGEERRKGQRDGRNGSAESVCFMGVSENPAKFHTGADTLSLSTGCEFLRHVVCMYVCIVADVYTRRWLIREAVKRTCRRADRVAQTGAVREFS